MTTGVAPAGTTAPRLLRRRRHGSASHSTNRPRSTPRRVQLDAMGTAVWLSELPGEPLPVRLAGVVRTIAELARRTVSAGRIVPVIVRRRPVHRRPLEARDDTAIDTTIDALAHRMPPICTAGSGVTQRRSTGSSSTASPGPSCSSTAGKPTWDDNGSRDGAGAARHLRRTGQARPRRTWRHRRVRHRRRADSATNSTVTGDGSPANRWSSPASASLISDDATRSVDRAPRTRRRPRQRPLVHRQRRLGPNGTALEVAKGTAHVDLLAELIGATVDQSSPFRASSNSPSQHEPTQVELELDVAEDFLDIAPVELQRMGIELIGPERLVRTRVSVTGEATPLQPTTAQAVRQRSARRLEAGDRRRGDLRGRDRPRRAGRAQPCSTPATDGSASTQTNSAANARSLTELQTTKSVVTPIELLRLANDDEWRRTYETCPAPSYVGRHHWRPWRPWPPWRLGPRTARRPPRRTPRRDPRARRLRRRAAPLPAPGTGLAAVPRPARPRWVPRRRHGPRQDRHHARPPRRAARPAPRGVSAQRRAQLESEAARFAPKLGVRIHHGSQRAQGLRADDTLFDADRSAS